MAEAVAPSLAELQQQFQRYVLEGADAIAGHVAAADAETGQRRLGIYANAYWLRLEEALRADYRGLHAVIGDADFRRLTRDYLRSHPSRYRSIRWFGSNLASFLATASKWRLQPLLTEMARFDWALSLALDAANAPALDLSHMAALQPEDWPGLQFRLHPAISRLRLHWNVPPLRRALLDGETPPDPHASPRALGWLIWRTELTARYRSLPPEEDWALDAAAYGADFGAICAGLADRLDGEEAAMEAATLLKRWVVDGLLLRPDVKVGS